jgi:hypothetical protein
MIYFSFSLYGTLPKYTRGMLANVEILQRRFPDACVAIFTADDVPCEIIETLHSYPQVTVIPTPRKVGCEGMLDRFLAIDLSDCDVMFVRDADSRVHERDAACVEDFLAAPDRLLHIIRDHRFHTHVILGGMWGIRKEGLIEPMSTSLERWKSSHDRAAYMADQYFVENTFYVRLLSATMIHDRYTQYEPDEKKSPFRVPIVEEMFVGQVHDYEEDGREKVIFKA